MINNIKADKLLLDLNFKMNDMTLIFSNEKEDYISFVKFISDKFKIKKIFDLNKSIKELNKIKLFDIAILKYFNAANKIIDLLDIENYFNEERTKNLNHRLNNYFESLINDDLNNSISIDYQINFSQEYNSKIYQKEIFFLKLLNKIIPKSNDMGPVLINVSDVLFSSKTKIQEQIIHELKILSEKNNIFIFVNVNSEETFRIFLDNLENTFLLYRGKTNEIELKRFLSKTKKEAYAVNNIFPTKQNHFNRLKNILRYSKLNLISSKESIFVFNREFQHIIKNYLQRPEDIYKLDDIKDSYYIVDLFKQINQTYKLKFIFDKTNIKDRYFEGLSKYLSQNNIKWTQISNIFDYDSMNLEKEEKFTKEEDAYLDNIKSFIEQRTPKVVYYQKDDKEFTNEVIETAFENDDLETESLIEKLSKPKSKLDETFEELYDESLTKEIEELENQLQELTRETPALDTLLKKSEKEELAQSASYTDKFKDVQQNEQNTKKEDDNNDEYHQLDFDYNEQTKELTIFDPDNHIINSVENLSEDETLEVTRDLLVNQISDKILQEDELAYKVTDSYLNKIEIIFNNNVKNLGRENNTPLNFSNSIKLNNVIETVIERLTEEEIKVILNLQKANLFTFILSERWNKEYGNVIDWDIYTKEQIEENLFDIIKGIAKTKVNIKQVHREKPSSNKAKVKKWKKH